MNIRIDPEFKELIPPLTSDERGALELNISNDGCLDPIKIWGDVIIDGHNRFEICTSLGYEFKTEQMHFPDRDSVRLWIISNQFGRRNLSAYSRSILALKVSSIIEKKAKENQIASGGDRKSVKQISAEPITPFETRKELAKRAEVSHDTIAKVKKIEQLATPEIKKALERQEISINQAHKEVKKIEQTEMRKTSPFNDDQLKRIELVKLGVTVVVNKSTDHALIQWAIDHGKFTLIDRNTEWGNPFELPHDGTRDDVCDNYENHYFPHKPSLLSKREKLKGRVLGCWCYPLRCHGDFLAKESMK